MVLSSWLCPFLTYANDHGEEGEMEILYIGATLGLIKRHRRNGCKALEMVKWNEKALPRGKWGAHEKRRRGGEGGGEDCRDSCVFFISTSRVVLLAWGSICPLMTTMLMNSAACYFSKNRWNQ